MDRFFTDYSGSSAKGPSIRPPTHFLLAIPAFSSYYVLAILVFARRREEEN